MDKKLFYSNITGFVPQGKGTGLRRTGSRPWPTWYGLPFRIFLQQSRVVGFVLV
jgi:hypothetical protein